MAVATTTSDIVLALTRYIQMTYGNDVDAITKLADQAFADLQAGKTVVSLSYEGASTSSVQNTHPADLLNACMDVLANLGVPGATRSVSQSIFQRFGSQPLQT